MKPLLEDLSDNIGSQAFRAFVVEQARFEFYWHYHPEYELTLILKGEGSRLVGDNHSNFHNEDLVLLGPGLPHTWVSSKKHKGGVTAVVVQFSTSFIERFADLEEMASIHDLLWRAQLGLCFKGQNQMELSDEIHALVKRDGINRITRLLHILHQLTNTTHIPLVSGDFQPLKGKEHQNRINKVCKFVQKNAHEKISLNKVASLIQLSPSAFCKFFKRITGKTFSDYVNDIRIANVCHQLVTTDQAIAEIAYANGFETLTYFNRVFLKKKGKSPKRYREGV